MKLIAFVIIAGLAACGSKGANAPANPTLDPAPTGQTSTGCAQEISIRCVSGVDGCMDGRTTAHVCVPSDAQAGPPCEQEIALQCPEGQEDACLRQPAVSDKHICVFK